MLNKKFFVAVVLFIVSFSIFGLCLSETTHPINISVTAKGNTSEVSAILIKVENLGSIISDVKIRIEGENTPNIDPFIPVLESNEVTLPKPIEAGKSSETFFPIEIPPDLEVGRYNLKLIVSFTDIDGNTITNSSIFYVEVKKPNVLVMGLRWFLDFLSQKPIGYGIGIILFSIIVKLALHPFNAAQLKSMSKMQELQPKIAEINKKYKDDAQKKADETMKLYREAKINPAAGCLPLIVQLIIVYFLYLALQGYTPLYKSSFLWLESLGSPDRYLIFPILAGITTLLQSLTGPQSADPQSKSLIYIMPVFFFLIMMRFPSALAIFWTIFGLISAIQQYYFRKKSTSQKVKIEGSKPKSEQVGNK
ncbi:MAG: YidC/Oxa1 family membrane protein insertase [Caldisericia bacterium]|jgi:YidC/Oxa1 family membrane protein insertase|nr:membrane protein insertase YidC [Caldisericia bacterium]MDD3427714.1 YidC/Oxa1 family membrane protein insertase [Caldisericia bacterium]MDD5689069.1 YidC/Oxa1 family membrane protein insertase [Caldisericia bacterium]HOJ16256.1 YidC/Oxa1 family membrane protein insertase [Caldisericia bacterium]HOW02728.1 YidC/Oxa1 family membrane protein insertase [Caldisericia bacterium]